MTTQNPLLVQILNVGIPSTIQWRFYNAKRFAVIPEWQMEKKLQFISDRITGWLSKRSIKNKWKLFTEYFVITTICDSNILWTFSIVFVCRPLGAHQNILFKMISHTNFYLFFIRVEKVVNDQLVTCVPLLGKHWVTLEKRIAVCARALWGWANTWEMIMMKITTNTSAMGPGCHHFHDCNVDEENIIQEVSLVTIWLIGANSKSDFNHGKGWNKRLRSSFSKHNLMLSRIINEL